jgi:hypothetical protein
MVLINGNTVAENQNPQRLAKEERAWRIVDTNQDH